VINEQARYNHPCWLLGFGGVALLIVAFAALAQESSDSKPTDAQQPLTITVVADKACLFAIDGKTPYRAQQGTSLSIRLAPGQHAVTAVTTDGKDYWETRWSADRDGATLIIPLQAQDEGRLRTESEATALRRQIARTKDEVAKARARNRSFVAETRSLAKRNDPEAPASPGGLTVASRYRN
jgi:hypothetical protein